jgi:uncharacterized RDD family membrane protein YckC
MNQPYSNNTDEGLLFPDLPVHYAGFWERFGAAILDALILAIPGYALEYMLGRRQGFLFTILLDWLYYALQESGAAQATLGKKALGLKVTSVDGTRISFGQATGRFFGRYVSAVILLIGYLMMLWDDKQQTLHDKMAGTVVIRQAQ